MGAPVKSTEGTSTLATVNASLGSASTPGNLLTLKVAADDYAASPPSGFTQSTGMKQETYHGGYFWWKISTGETSVNYTIGSAANSSWVMEEYAGPFDGSPYDTSNGTLAISSAGSATTPNITPSAGDRLVLSAFGSSNSSGDMSGDLSGFTNGFTHTRSSGPASATGTRDNIGGAYLDVTANGSTAYNTTASFPFTKQSHSAMIIAFKKASGGGSPQTLIGTRFDNTNTFYGGTIQRGAVTLVGTRFNNTNSFYGGTIVRGAVTLTGTLFTDPDTFYGGNISQSGGPQTLVGSLFTNSQTFFGGTIKAKTTLTGTLFTDGDAFYGGTIKATYTVAGTLYSDPDTFFGGTIVQPNTPQTITGQLYANDNRFFGGTVIGGVQPVKSDQTDTHDGRVWDFSQSERDEHERTRARRASEKQLRRTIERAVNIVRGSDEVPSQVAPVEASRPHVAELVMMEINTNGLSASLESIERLLAQYEAQIADEELENEALALLLLAA